jgi:hypothetical protein
MEITSEDFDKIVDYDIGIDITLRRKSQTIDSDYGSLTSHSFQEHIIKAIWQEITGNEENFRPEGEFKIGDIKCYTKNQYENIAPTPETDTIFKENKEYKIVKSTIKTAGNTVIYRLLQLRLK